MKLENVLLTNIPVTLNFKLIIIFYSLTGKLMGNIGLESQQHLSDEKATVVVLKCDQPWSMSNHKIKPVYSILREKHFSWEQNALERNLWSRRMRRFKMKIRKNIQ